MKRYVDISRLEERRGWLGANSFADPQDLPEANYQGGDPAIEALRREWWPREELRAA